jgi:1-acyl-sn-glycerol-3-phosphate acyltransferase
MRDPDAFASALLAMLGARDPAETEALKAVVYGQLRAASEADLRAFFDGLESAGSDWGHRPAEALARGLSRAVLRHLLEPGSALEAGAELGATRGRRVLLLGNHLSFVDANVLELLLADFGHADLAERLTVIVGPKVYARPLRRIASLCFGTIKTPQSASRATGEAVMSPREVARIALQSLDAARDRLAKGDALLVFVEGTRSRTGAMQRALAGIGRYLERSDALVVPFGLSGSEHLTPIGETERLERACVVARIGAPLEAATIVQRCARKRPLVMDVVGCLVADCLPAPYRGAYAARNEELAEARAIADELSEKGFHRK